MKKKAIRYHMKKGRVNYIFNQISSSHAFKRLSTLDEWSVAVVPGPSIFCLENVSFSGTLKCGRWDEFWSHSEKIQKKENGCDNYRPTCLHRKRACTTEFLFADKTAVVFSTWHGVEHHSFGKKNKLFSNVLVPARIPVKEVSWNRFSRDDNGTFFILISCWPVCWKTFRNNVLFFKHTGGLVVYNLRQPEPSWRHRVRSSGSRNYMRL